jgi:regulatory protein
LIRRVELSDGSLFSFKIVYLPPEYSDEVLCVSGRELSGEETEALRFAAACFKTERAALRLVGRAEQCSFGLSRKLETRGHGSAPVRAALEQLCNLEIVDDERFARSWLRARLSRTAGASAANSPRNLLAALCRRGISRGTAQRALKSVLDTETELAIIRRRLAKEGFEADQSRDDDTNRRLRYRLKQEGFSADALEILRETGEL